MHRNLKLSLNIVLLLTFVTGAFGQDVRSHEEMKAKLEKEIAMIDRQLAENASRSNSMLADLELIRKKVSNRKALVSQSERQIRKYNDEIYLKQLQINRLKERIEVLTEHYERLVLSAYKNRDARVWYMYMLASENIGQAFRRFGYFRNLSETMKNESLEINQAKQELEEEKAELSRMKKDAEKIKAERVKELEKLRADESKSNTIVKQLNRNKKKYQAQLKKKRKEIEALNREIERMISSAVGGSGKSTSRKRTEVDPGLAAEFVKNKGKLPWPADGVVTGHFGTHYHPVYKNLQLPPNNGFDITVSKGENIAAVFAGVVQQVMVIPGFNQCVMIDHGNYFTLYCKLKSVTVKAGDKVKTGQMIGTIDTINGQTQLHFELWQGKKAQNPEQWLRK